MTRIWATMLLLAFAATPRAEGADPSFDPVTGYRIAHYRGVVDRAPEGVERIDAARAAALRVRSVLLDVTPAEGAVRDADGTWHLAAPHATIPGAHWFPDGIDGWVEFGRALVPAAAYGDSAAGGGRSAKQVFREIRAFRIYDRPPEVHKWSLTKKAKRDWRERQP